MREIKFRGKHLDKWLYGSLHMNESGQPAIATPSTFHFRCVDPDTVGQYTGLLDRNDKEIYEGDIIEVNRGCCERDGIHFDFIFHAVVFWDKSGFMYKGPGIFSGSFNNVKVIGNVHDNPSLLESNA